MRVEGLARSSKRIGNCGAAKDDEEIAGLLTGETGEDIDLLLPAGIHRAVKKNDISRREIQNRSPMPEGLIQTPAELRDLLAFLISQK